MRMHVCALLSVILGCAHGARAEQEFDGTVAFRYVVTQLSFGPRVPNTEGHRKTGDWILEHLRATADSAEEQAFVHMTAGGDTLLLRNLIGRFRPESAERILYVAHWDTRPVADRSANLGDQRLPVPGANDGASGLALLLGVADALLQQQPRYGVDLLFVDGEDYGSFSDPELHDVLIGSQYYAKNLDPTVPRPLFAVVWDMIGDREWRILQEGNSLAGAPEVVQRVWERARAVGYERVFRRKQGQYITDDNIPLQDAGIRAIDVIDLEFASWHTLEDTLDKVSSESLQIVGEVAVAMIR